MQSMLIEYFMQHNSCNQWITFIGMEKTSMETLFVKSILLQSRFFHAKNSIDEMVHRNLARKMQAMYDWLNDLI